MKEKLQKKLLYKEIIQAILLLPAKENSSVMK